MARKRHWDPGGDGGGALPLGGVTVDILGADIVLRLLEVCHHWREVHQGPPGSLGVTCHTHVEIHNDLKGKRFLKATKDCTVNMET